MPASITLRRLLLLAAAGLVLVYGIVLPACWPTPTVRVDLPRRTPVDVDLPVRVTASAWHANFAIVGVRFYVDPVATTAHGPAGPLYPVLLHMTPQDSVWPFWSINRVTWPHSRALSPTLPLRELSEKRIVQPGVIVGKVDVTLEYLRWTHQRLAFSLGYTTSQTTCSVPFTLVLE